MPYRTDLKRPDLKGSFRCSLCFKIFCHSSSLSRHRMQSHFKSYTCTLCNKEITTPAFKTRARSPLFSILSLTEDRHLAMMLAAAQPLPQVQPKAQLTPPQTTTVDMENNRPQKKAYKELTLEEKVSLIRMAEKNPNTSQAQIAKVYEIAKSNVCRILKRKYEYLAAYESWNFSGDRKRKLRDSDTKELNLLVRAWCEDMKKKGIPLTGALIQEKAREISQMLKINNFVASNGWLQSFQKSFNIDCLGTVTKPDQNQNQSNETLRAHMYKQHQISRMFMCRCCNWAFPDKTSLHIHMQAMATGNPGNVSIIAKSSASPTPPQNLLKASVESTQVKSENGVSSAQPVAAIPPNLLAAAGLNAAANGIFPMMPTREDVLQRLRERALMNGAAQAGLNLAAFLSGFPKVDASGVGSLGGTLNLMDEGIDDGNNNHSESTGNGSEGSGSDEGGEMAEMVIDEDGSDKLVVDESPPPPDNSKEDADKDEGNDSGVWHMEEGIPGIPDLPMLRNAISSSPLNSLLYKKRLSSALKPQTPTASTPEPTNTLTNGAIKTEPTEAPSVKIDSDGEGSPTMVANARVSPTDTHSSGSQRSPTHTPTHSTCFTCQIFKGKLSLSENRNRFLEGKVTSLESKISRLESKLATMDANSRRYESEGRNLREQNEQMQRKLIRCQEKALAFLQTGMGDTQATQKFITEILQNTYLG